MRSGSEDATRRKATAGRPARTLLVLALAAAAAQGSSANGPGSFEAALAAAADASRSADLAAARRALEPWLAEPAEAARARTVLGLLAHAHADPKASAQLLGVGPGPDGLEDWRLYVLADSRAALGAVDAARATLVELLARHPDSPLRPRAIRRAIELAARAGDLPAVRDRVAFARAERMPAAERAELERAVWSLALEHGEGELLAEAGRQLLVVAPMAAAELRVVDVLAARRAPGGDWRLWLEPDELVARAEALIGLELPSGALTTLAAVAPERRGFSWQLLQARALTASGRGPEALGVLVTSVPPTSPGGAALAWERAQASLEAAQSRSDRRVAIAESERLRRQAREQLLIVARHPSAGELAPRALARLGEEHLREGRSAEAVACYRQLRALDPEDRSGARPLWERGWSEYAGGQPVRAIAAWRDLIEIYPATPSARAARYWTARALEALGRPEQARPLYTEILAADTADFYARQAGLRLAGARRAAGPTAARESWPDDPRLARARALTDTGLDALARAELDLVGAEAEPRATLALSAVVHARSGARRQSLDELRRAFPALATSDQARVPELAYRLFYPTDFRDEVVRAAQREGLPADLLFGIVHQESAFDPGATSRSGARGLMQLLPSTGREVARKMGLPFSSARLHEPDYALRLGARYFRQMLGVFDGNVELALAAYNGGPGRISRLWRAAGPAAELDRFLEGLSVTESRNYVKRILVLSASYRSLYPDLG